MSHAVTGHARRVSALVLLTTVFAVLLSTLGSTPAYAVSISGISPNSGTTLGGDTIVITGADFTGTTDVAIGGNLTGFTVDSDTQITATTPPGTAGTVDVMVVGALGMYIEVGGFTYIAPASAPDAPTALNATPGDTQVSLSWTAPAANGSPITDYVVEYDDGSGWTTFNDGTSATTSATVTGLTNGVTYDFRVSAVNAIGTSSASATASATPTAPVAPTLSTVSPASGSTAGGTSVTITGTGFTGATDVQFDAVAAASFTVDSATQITATTPAHAAGLIAVTVTTPAGSATAPDAFEYVAPATAPDAPTGLNATPGDTQVDLSWTAPASDGGSAITDYEISYNIVGDTPGTPASLGTTGTSTTVTGLTNGIQYEFQIRAVNAAGASTWTSHVTATPAAGATAPDAPTGLNASAGDTQVDLSWTAPASDGGSAITDYVVEYNDGSGWTTFNDGTSATTSATVTGLTNGVTYDFRVSAINAIGTGSPSGTATATPAGAATAPGAPTWVSATADNGSITVTWGAPASDGGSTITQYGINYDDFQPAIMVTAPASSYTITGLTNGTTYTIGVYAVNAIGNSALSSTATATPTAPAPEPEPEPQPQTVTITWNANGGTCDAATSTVLVGATVSAPTCTAAAGYTANGWDRAVPFIAVSDATVTAQWTRLPTPGKLTVTETTVRDKSITFVYAYDDSSPVDTFVIVDKDGNLACSSTQGSENANTCTAVGAQPGTYYAFAKANGVEGPRSEVEAKTVSRWTKKFDFIIPSTSVANQGSMVVRVENVEPGCQVAYRLLNPGGIRKFTALRIANDDASSSARVQFGGWRGDWTVQIAVSRCPTAASDSFETTVRVRAN